MSGRSVYANQELFVKYYDLARWYRGMSLASAVGAAITELARPGSLAAIVAAAPSTGLSFQMPGFVPMKTPVFIALPTGEIVFDSLSLHDIAGDFAKKLEKRGLVTPTSGKNNVPLQIQVERLPENGENTPLVPNREKNVLRKIHPIPAGAQAKKTVDSVPSSDQKGIGRIQPIQAEAESEIISIGNKRGWTTTEDCNFPRKKEKVDEFKAEASVGDHLQNSVKHQSTNSKKDGESESSVVSCPDLCGERKTDSASDHSQQDQHIAPSSKVTIAESSESVDDLREIICLESGRESEEQEEQTFDTSEPAMPTSSWSNGLGLCTQNSKSREDTKLCKLYKVEKEMHETEATVRAELQSVVSFSKEIVAMSESRAEKLFLEHEIGQMHAEFMNQVTREFKERRESEVAAHYEHLRIIREIYRVLSLEKSEDRSHRLDDKAGELSKFERQLAIERDARKRRQNSAKAARLKICAEFCEQKSAILLETTRKIYGAKMRELWATSTSAIVALENLMPRT